MSDAMILGVGIAVFVLLLIGIVLTMIEFRTNVYPQNGRASTASTERAPL